jgi:3-mercaptopyruvate sulfurtransferase SseA
VLKYGDREYAWNPYLLTSLGTHRIKNARILNDGLSAYVHTAVIVPPNAEGVEDLINYVLKSFPVGYFASAEDAFDYLKMNNLRLGKSEKLMKTINEILGIC